MLMRFRDFNQLEISVDEFKTRLGIDDKYPLFPDLKRRVIQPAVDELGEKSGLEISWDVTRKGRAVTGLVFMFNDKEQLDLEF